jgi:hypothetical protein
MEPSRQNGEISCLKIILDAYYVCRHISVEAQFSQLSV